MRLDWAISDKKRAKHSLHRRKRLRRFHAPRGYGHLHKVQPQLCEVAGMESFSGLVCKWVSSLQRPYVPLKVYCLRGGERQDRKPGRGRDCRIIPPLCKIMLGAFRFVPGSMSRRCRAGACKMVWEDRRHRCTTCSCDALQKFPASSICCHEATVL